MPRCHSEMRSWNTHALITRAAFSASNLPRLKEPVTVIALEIFLTLAKSTLPEVIKWHNSLLDRKVLGTARKMVVRPRIPDTILTHRDFLTAFKLNANQPVHYVRVLSPEEVSPDTPHDPSRAGPPGGTYAETEQGEIIQAKDVLSTFSDEPDWGMDQDLFADAEYGYGACPFGSEHGPSSQAAFHMAFLHENPLIMAVWPRLGRSFMEERIQLFFALARLAFENGANYWGWRFTSWAMHYLQDLTQPYHARALPSPVLPLLFRFLLNPNPGKFAEKNENYLKNRHWLFESAIHFILNEAVKKDTNHSFLQALSIPDGDSKPDHGFRWKTGPQIDVKPFIKELARVPADLAPRIDRALMDLMNDRRISDSSYSLANDAGYKICETLPAARSERPSVFDDFVRLVSPCLALAGEVSRHTVGMVA